MLKKTAARLQKCFHLVILFLTKLRLGSRDINDIFSSEKESLMNLLLYLSVLEIVIQSTKPISGRVNRASATETVDTGSIPGRVKPTTIKIGIHSFPA